MAFNLKGKKAVSILKVYFKEEIVIYTHTQTETETRVDYVDRIVLFFFIDFKLISCPDEEVILSINFIIVGQILVWT